MKTIDNVAESLKEYALTKNIKIRVNHQLSEGLFVLGNDISNPVIEYLQSKQYSYHHLKKISKYSEVNSIMNLILGKMCNGIFIGARGTAFTHVLQIYYDTDDRVTSYFVNMDNIDL